MALSSFCLSCTMTSFHVSFLMEAHFLQTSMLLRNISQGWLAQMNIRYMLEPMLTRVLGDDGSFRVTWGNLKADGVKGERSIVTFRVYSKL